MRRCRPAIPILALVLVLAACGGSDDPATGAAGPPAGEPAGRVDQADVRPDLEPVAYDVLLPVAIDDIERFWSVALPEAYGFDYQPLPAENFIPYSEDAPPPPCGGQELSYDDMAGNAYYCYPDDYLAWDDQQLFPDLYRNFGPFAVAMVLAHEWGHAIQDQTGFQAATIVMEQQADCFAGAWSAWTLDEGDRELGFRLADLEVALGGMLQFRDELGTLSDDPHAHGSGFDRINAFQEGFEYGPARCAEYEVSPPTVLDLAFLDEQDEQSGGNMGYDDAIYYAARDLNDYWSSLNSTFPRVEEIVAYDPATDGLPTCDGRQLDVEEATYAIFFCAEENAVVWDDVMMRTVHEHIGDFGVATLLGVRWTEAAQRRLGVDAAFITSREGVLQQACFTGSWAGRLMVPDEQREIYALSPGDLDEAIQAFLAFAESPDQRGQTRAGSAFERAQAFRIGFFDGAAACDEFSA